MAFVSFENYYGQYHISAYTQPKAGLIYSNWINSNFENFKENTVLLVEYQSKIAGYCTIIETDTTVEGVLSSVSPEIRNIGAYKSMINYLIDYAAKQNKRFIASTQLDNYIVQGTWNSLGLVPYYSIYNFHFNNI